MKGRSDPLPVRFEEKVLRDPGGCWLWQGEVNARGYGRIKRAGRKLFAHRVAHEIHKGAIPEGTEIDHLCRVKHCVNPDHLEAVPHEINVGRGRAGARQREKTRCKHGHPFSEENTRWRGDGSRACKQCQRKRALAHYHRTRRIK